MANFTIKYNYADTKYENWGEESWFKLKPKYWRKIQNKGNTRRVPRKLVWFDPKYKKKIKGIQGESQCLFQRKIGTRWLSGWSRQLPQHHLLFFRRNIHFSYNYHTLTFTFTLTLSHFLSGWSQQLPQHQHSHLSQLFSLLIGKPDEEHFNRG